MTFVYLSREYIKDETSCIMRAPFFSDLVDSYERSIHMGDNLIPYFQDSNGHYCITYWGNINDEHVKMTLKDVERFGRDTK